MHTAIYLVSGVGQSLYNVASQSVQLTVSSRAAAAPGLARLLEGTWSVGVWLVVPAEGGYPMTEHLLLRSPLLVCAPRTRLHCGKPAGSASSAWLFPPCSSLSLLLPLWLHYRSDILTILPYHCLLHIAAPTTIGRSSLTVTCTPFHD